jgi:hypothetical protein
MVIRDVSPGRLSRPALPTGDGFGGRRMPTSAIVLL